MFTNRGCFYVWIKHFISCFRMCYDSACCCFSNVRHFYAEKKQVRFSLRRTSMWYSCMFALAFIPSVLYMTLK